MGTKIKEQATEAKEFMQQNDEKFDDILTMREKDIQQQKGKMKHENRHKYNEYSRRLNELLDELDKIKRDLEVARRNESDTGPIYKDKQNCEKEISQLRHKMFELSNGHGGKSEDEKNIEKARLLTRQGIVNIRPSIEGVKRKND
ncbi:MAG TPA: hypothetical protein VMT35_01315 [Ignavibacteriaceae bacterium]|jgi:hypothetical protein|nr:hypothetical protein [Ignavibacteriaceae bacterium]